MPTAEPNERTMKESSFIIADVFAGAPFEGNQLAVFTDATGLTRDQMQRAANEIGYSETTFLLPTDISETDLKVRIFTPHEELPFAGHPLVGSGFVAAVERLVPCDPSVLRFATGVGRIEVRPEIRDSRSGRAWMVQPYPSFVKQETGAELVAELAPALGVDAERIAVSRSPVAVMDNGLRMMIVPVDSLETIERLSPNPRVVAAVCKAQGAKTMLVFTTETVHERSAAHCRVFAPGAGVDEDPATGSANGPFGVYLRYFDLAASDELEIEQGYEMGRPSALHVALGRDAAGRLDGVSVGGGVFVTGRGTLYFEE